jgi:hypothetical protein
MAFTFLFGDAFICRSFLLLEKRQAWFAIDAFTALLIESPVFFAPVTESRSARMAGRRI